MPIRGESVGTAYIRVIADGSSIPRDIEDEFDEVNHVADRQGSRFAKNWKKAVGEELDKNDSDSLENALVRALAADKAVEKFFSGSDWNGVKTRFNQEWGNLGDSEIAAMEARFRRAGSLSGIEHAIETSVSRINADFDKDLIKAQKDARFAEVVSELMAERLRRTIDLNATSMTRALDRTRLRFTGFRRSVDKDGRTLVTTFGRIGTTIDHIAETTGRAFGRGSRNDFLNFTGSFITNSVKLLGVVPKILDNIGQFGKGFSNALSAGEGFFTSISKGFSAMAADAEGGATALGGVFSSVGSLLIALPVLAAALAGVVAILGIVAALASALTGIIIALAGSISFALIGALAPLVGLLAPIALGIGGVVLAIATLTKKARAELLKPFVDELKDLGKTAREGFSEKFTGSIGKLVDSMKLLHPLVEGIGEAFGTIATNIASGLQGHAFQHFLDMMTRFVPEALISLSKIASNVGGALALIFEDTIPDAKSLLGWLEHITREFRNFLRANPDKVRSFLDDAADSAHSLGDFLGAAARLLGTLLGAGKGTGDSIFDSLTTNINKFNDLLKKNPKALSDFFANAKQVADEIGRIAIALGQIFDKLDTPQNRRNLNDVLDLLSKIGGLAGPIGEVGLASVYMGNSLVTLAIAFAVLRGPAGDVLGLIGRIGGAIAGFVASVGNIHLPNFDFVSHIKNAFKGLGDLFKGPGGGSILAIKPPSLAWIAPTLNRIGGFVSDVTHAAGRVSFAAFGTEARTAVATIGRLFGSVPGRLQGLAIGIGNAASHWGAVILNRVSSIPGQIINFFTGLGSRIASAIGSISLHFDFPNPPSWLAKAGGTLGRFTASGGIFSGAQNRIIGERGAEAVVPLTGPLSAVDPSVRELSAIARGLKENMGHTVQTLPAGKTVNVEQHITTVATDPLAAASEFLNHLTAVVA